MRVLIGCEFSGVIRDAFAAKGHDAWSCDLLPTESPGNHIEGDVLEVIEDGWDLAILHPPCTYLSFAGTHCWNAPGRAELREAAFEFFMKMVNAPIEKICVENPKGYPNVAYRKPDQIIHPYYFGDEHMKLTCLWLKNLPKLIHIPQDDLFNTKTHAKKPEPIYVDKKTGKKRHFTEHFGSGKDRGKKRSVSFPGVADAMANQWNF